MPRMEGRIKDRNTVAATVRTRLLGKGLKIAGTYAKGREGTTD